MLVSRDMVLPRELETKKRQRFPSLAFCIVVHQTETSMATHAAAAIVSSFSIDQMESVRPA